MDTSSGFERKTPPLASEVSAEKFVDHRKVMFPRKTFVELDLSLKDVSKIRQWVKNGCDKIGVFPYATQNKLVLINWTRFEKWKRAKR